MFLRGAFGLQIRKDGKEQISSFLFVLVDLKSAS